MPAMSRHVKPSRLEGPCVESLGRGLGAEAARTGVRAGERMASRGESPAARSVQLARERRRLGAGERTPLSGRSFSRASCESGAPAAAAAGRDATASLSAERERESERESESERDRERERVCGGARCAPESCAVHAYGGGKSAVRDDARPREGPGRARCRTCAAI